MQMNQICTCTQTRQGRFPVKLQILVYYNVYSVKQCINKLKQNLPIWDQHNHLPSQGFCMIRIALPPDGYQIPLCYPEHWLSQSTLIMNALVHSFIWQSTRPIPTALCVTLYLSTKAAFRAGFKDQRKDLRISVHAYCTCRFFSVSLNNHFERRCHVQAPFSTLNDIQYCPKVFHFLNRLLRKSQTFLYF